jgi:DNA-binding MarR family transcriptional regulator
VTLLQIYNIACHHNLSLQAMALLQAAPFRPKDITVMPQPSIHSITKRLVKKGLVTRNRIKGTMNDPGKGVEIRLTEEGTKLINSIQ